MTGRILLVCVLAVAFISACSKEPEKSTATTATTAGAEVILSATSKTNPALAADSAPAPTTEKGQNGTTEPGSEPQELVADKEAGKQLAQQCQKCHGIDGNKTVDGSPYLAGQQSKYLVTAMQSYLDEEREHEEMKNALQALTKGDILNLATYYSDQAANWKQVKKAKTTKTIAVNKRTIARGKQLSSQCTGCHGQKGNAPIDGSPSLAGLPPAYFKSAFLDYFKGNRREKKVIMKHFSRSLSKSNVAHLAAYFSTQTPKKTQFPIKGNINAGKKIATQACNGCHGMNGNSGSPTIPSLTGHNANYLVMALQTYKNGMRKNKMMKEAVAKYKNSQLVNLAAYYAKQQPKIISPSAITTSKGFDPIGQGGSIASGCNGCHGANGNSSISGTPSLSGLDPQYITMAINTYKTDQRKHNMMKGFVANLSEADIEKVALYYASQEPATTSPARIKTLKADTAAGEAAASACTGCHGDKGNSSQADTPSIAGQEPGYIVSALNAYKSGKRENDAMKNAVAELTSPQIKNFAAYFATQSRSKPEIRLPEAPEVLAEKCFRCHGHNGLSTDGTTPRLAGQLESYLFNALEQYSNETRKQSTMHAMAANLTPLEQKAIAKYFSQLK